MGTRTPENARPLDSFEVRPDIPWERYVVFGALMGALTTAIGGFLLVTLHGDRWLGGVIATGLIGGILVAGAIRLAMIELFSRVGVDGPYLLYVSTFGIRHRYPRSTIDRLARSRVRFTVRNTFDVNYFVFVGRDGRARFKLSDKWWPGDDLERVAHKLGLPITGSFMDTVSAPQFRHELPGALPWVLAHSLLASVLLGVLITPLVVGAMFVIQFVAEWIR